MEAVQGDKQTRTPGRPPMPEPVEPKQKRAKLRSAFQDTSFWGLCRRIPALLGQIARMAWAIDRRDVMLLVGCQIASGVAAAVVLAATAKAMVPLLGGGLVPDRVGEALPALAVVAVAAAVGRVAYGLAAWAVARLKPRVMTAADTALVRAMLSVELEAFNHASFAEEHEHAETGVVRCERMLYDAQSFMAALIRLVAAFGVVTVLHPLMLPVLTLAVLPSGIGAVAEAKIEHRTHYENAANRNLKGMMRWHITTSGFANEVRANSMRRYLMFWYETLSCRIDGRTVAAAGRQVRTNLIAAAAGGVCLTGAWATLVWLTVSGQVSLAVSATAVVAVRTALGNLTNVVHYSASLFHSSLFLGDWKRFVDTTTADVALARGGEQAPVCPETIRLENVTYAYPNKPHPAVDDLSLTLRRGEVVAVVGENGSGKSSLIKLVTGLYLAEKGTVTWDGVDLASVDPDTVWAQTGLVPQFFACWPLACRENITLGQPVTWDDEAVWDVVETVGMREAVEELPDGLDMLLAREVWGGVTLSGGQWQRLACGRAIYRKPAVLVLDEPTSEMDARGEHLIFQVLKEMAAERISIVVTHRLENTKIADRIIVMERGRITEQGTFDQLVRAGGLFQELYELSQDR
ncbi:ABC transporter ATP-binding protein [Streptomyces triculaminicus]|uniref:ABC transporter ATP-binding protein n=2 Tax=Streptomyces TaxID=1883 RepID=A0A939FM17_9ACTN|nr:MULTISPECIES: ABC transporter ATP-binding protein [Streptomyces]MBO0654515.1 ABC transporter ATP-binding protein [Streptomyces triculaminicus]QSY49128.1 ABC transporter ATP-binding protein [Streptomyces griseocarneus]